MEEKGSEGIADETSSSLAPSSSPGVVLNDVGVAALAHSAPQRLQPAPPPPPPPSSTHGGRLATTGIPSPSHPCVNQAKEKKGSEAAARIADETCSSLAPNSSPRVGLSNVGVAAPVQSSAPPRLHPTLPPPPSSTHGGRLAATGIADELSSLARDKDVMAAEAQVPNPTPVTSPAPPLPPSSTHDTHGGRLAATGSSSASSSSSDHVILEVIPETGAEPNTAPPRLPPPAAAPPLPPSTYGGGGTSQRPWERLRPSALSSRDDSTLPFSPKPQPSLDLGLRQRHHVNHDQVSSSLPWLSIQEEEELKQRELRLNQMEQDLRNRIREAIKSRREHAIKRAEDIIELDKKKESIDQQEEVMAAQEHKFQMDKEEAKLLNREKLLDERDEALRKPLIQHVRNKEEKEDSNVWDKRQNAMAIALVCGLSVLISVQPQLPPDYLSIIVGVFAWVWVLATIACFQEGLFGVYSFQKTFSRHASRMIFISFCIFVIYVLYILSSPLSTVSSSCDTSSSSPAPPPAPAPSSNSHLDGRTCWYIVLVIIAVLGHLGSWILGCASGGDKEP